MAGRKLEAHGTIWEVQTTATCRLDGKSWEQTGITLVNPMMEQCEPVLQKQVAIGITLVEQTMEQ